MHDGTTGKRSMSAYTEDLIQRQFERDRLRELIDNTEAEHGQVNPVAVDAKRAILRGRSSSASAD